MAGKTIIAGAPRQWTVVARPRASFGHLAAHAVLREGTETDLLTYVDGALLIDLWEDLVLRSRLREA